MANRKNKKNDVDYLQVISDLAEIILLGLEAGPILHKHKSAIDEAFSHVIMKNHDPRLDRELEALAKRFESDKKKKPSRKKS